MNASSQKKNKLPVDFRFLKLAAAQSFQRRLKNAEEAVKKAEDQCEARVLSQQTQNASLIADVKKSETLKSELLLFQKDMEKSSEEIKRLQERHQQLEQNKKAKDAKEIIEKYKAELRNSFMCWKHYRNAKDVYRALAKGSNGVGEVYKLLRHGAYKSEDLMKHIRDMKEGRDEFTFMSLMEFKPIRRLRMTHNHSEENITPLMAIIIFEKYGVLSPLFSLEDCDVDAGINEQTTPSKFTALHYAIQMNASPAHVQLLLDHGADPKLQDASGNTPEDYLDCRVKSLGFLDLKEKSKAREIKAAFAKQKTVGAKLRN